MGGRYKVYSDVMGPMEIGVFIREILEKEENKSYEVVVFNTIMVDNGILFTLILDDKVEAAKDIMNGFFSSGILADMNKNIFKENKEGFLKNDDIM